jgi:hypothetical protein
MRKAATRAGTNTPHTIRTFDIWAFPCTGLLSLLFPLLFPLCLSLQPPTAQVEGCHHTGNQEIFKQAAGGHRRRSDTVFDLFLRRTTVLPAASIGLLSFAAAP